MAGLLGTNRDQDTYWSLGYPTRGTVCKGAQEPGRYFKPRFSLRKSEVKIQFEVAHQRVQK